MNWFKRAARYRVPVEQEMSPQQKKRFEDRWNFPVPNGYELVQDDGGNWGVLRPARYNGEPEQSRVLLKHELTENFQSPDVAKQRVLDQSLSRIGFENQPETEGDDEQWAKKFQQWQAAKQQSTAAPVAVQAWAMRVMTKHASSAVR